MWSQPRECQKASSLSGGLAKTAVAGIQVRLIDDDQADDFLPGPGEGIEQVRGGGGDEFVGLPAGLFEVL
jgi:hypothetical protein